MGFQALLFQCTSQLVVSDRDSISIVIGKKRNIPNSLWIYYLSQMEESVNQILHEACVSRPGEHSV